NRASYEVGSELWRRLSRLRQRWLAGPLHRQRSVYPEIELISSEIRYKQINSLFHNDGNGRFTEVSKLSGNGFDKPHTGRGVAFADFDNDGNIDVVVGNDGEAPLLLHNGGAPGNHFLTLKLVGTRSNRDAMGARVKLR